MTLEEEQKRKETVTDDDLIMELKLSLRTYNLLRRAGVATVGQLRKMTEGELMSCKNMTQKAFDEIIKQINCLVKTGKKE